MLNDNDNPIRYPVGARVASVRTARYGSYHYYEIGIYEVRRRASDDLMVWHNIGCADLRDRTTPRAAKRAYIESDYSYPLLDGVRHGRPANP